MIYFSGWTDYDPPALSADLRPTGDRSGLHLSDVIHSMKVAAGEKVGAIDGDQPGTRMMEGFVWESALEYIASGMALDEALETAFKRHMLAWRKDICKQVTLEKDGIRMTPDGFIPGAGELESWKCVAPETRLLTRQLTWVPAGDLKTGDAVAGFTEDEIRVGKGLREWRDSTIVSATDVRRKRTRLVFSSGHEVVCSDDHQWLVRWGSGHSRPVWRPTRELTRGMSILRLTPTWEMLDSYEAGWLAGMYDGEGSLVTRRYGRQDGQASLQVMLSQNRGPTMDRAADTLSRLGFVFSRLDVKDKASRLSISKKLEALRLLGSVRPQRLLDKFAGFDRMGCTLPVEYEEIEVAEPIGQGPVMAIETTTKTYVAEGLASHNCTRRSFKKATRREDFEENFWPWIVQEQSYALALGVDTVSWIVLFQAGDYGKGVGTGPVVKRATATFGADELAANWQVVLEYAKGLRG